MITFLVHLYQTTGIIGASKRDHDRRTAGEKGYSKLNGTSPSHRDNGYVIHDGDEDEEAEAYELAEHDLSGGDEVAMKKGGQDEVDWMEHDRLESSTRVRI